MQPFDPRQSIKDAYAAFNERRINDALALMSDDVDWPKASEGGRAKGKPEIRDYWTRQWDEFNARVEPVEILADANGIVRVRVHQTVESLTGDTLFDGEVWHIYRIENNLIKSMEISATADHPWHASHA
jgi:hypothetical protein